MINAKFMHFAGCVGANNEKLMSPAILVILVSVAAVAFFVTGMAITLLIKGRHIESEIGQNPNMKKLGLKCAVQEMKEEERALRGKEACATDLLCGEVSCSSCSADPEKE